MIFVKILLAIAHSLIVQEKEVIEIYDSCGAKRDSTTSYNLVIAVDNSVVLHSSD